MNEERIVTYAQAVANQWVIAGHRLAYSKANQKPCRCEDCRAHLAAMADISTEKGGVG